jgi:hypothetical protein
MGRDRVLFDTLIGGGQPDFSPSMTFTAADFVGTRMTSSKSAIRNAFLCLLATRNPVNLENNGHLDLIGGGITDFTSNEKHHIFPQAYLKRAWPDNADVHAVPNFCFIPAELNKRISDSDPATYFPQLRDGNHDFEAAARTQLLPTATDAGVWDNDYPKFLAARAGLLVEEVQRLCGEITTPRQEERQAAVQRMEHRLRDRIQAVLMAAAGQGYWKMRIPSDVRETADGRIDDALRKHPDMESAAFENPRARLDYLNVMDYLTIIDSGLNWPQFESTFRSKQDLQNHLRAFSEYRNAVVNSRPMSELVRMAGETAMVWFGTVLPPNEAEEAEEENPPEGSESEPEGEEADE